MTDFRCAEEARLRGDPMVGTAPPARRWLLVEQPAGWATEAVEGLLVTPVVRATLQAAARATAARVLLIRRPGRPAGPDATQRSWCVVDAGAAEAVRWGTWHADRDSDLLAAAEAIRDTTPATSGVGETGTAPDGQGLLLVCTHGRHDVCCAVRGRPVAAALAQRWPEATWECSHVGGDRFAANVIVLPDGACYGGLDAEVAPGVVAAHVRGEPDPAYLRGVSGLPPAAQAAVVAAHRELAPLRWGAARPTGAREVAPGEWQVDLQVAGRGAYQASVRERVQEAHRLTCRALRDNRATVPVVVGLHTIAG